MFKKHKKKPTSSVVIDSLHNTSVTSITVRCLKQSLAYKYLYLGNSWRIYNLSYDKE